MHLALILVPIEELTFLRISSKGAVKEYANKSLTKRAHVNAEKLDLKFVHLTK